jgi:hypothetical protein
VIQDPRLDGDVLTYSVKVLDGTVPNATGPCALFIDRFGRPLSPVSAAGCTGERGGGADRSRSRQRLLGGLPGPDREFESIDDGSCNELSKKVHLSVGDGRATAARGPRIDGWPIVPLLPVARRRAVSCNISWSTR